MIQREGMELQLSLADFKGRKQRWEIGNNELKRSDMTES